MKKNLRTILLLLFLTFGFAGVQTTRADDPPSDCTPGDPDYDPNQCIPIDGGLAFLLVAGVGYGLKKYRANQKNSSGNADTVL